MSAGAGDGACEVYWRERDVSAEDPPSWYRSTRCASGQCIEVAKAGEQYLIRDSKRPDVAPLSFTEAEWTAFVQGVAAGEFRFQ